MKYRAYIRLFFVVLIASISLILFSYSRTSRTSTPACSQECNENGTGNCEQKKSQTEFIIWESLSRNLLSINH